MNLNFKHDCKEKNRNTFEIILPVHILAGTTSLLIGTLILITQKGGKECKKTLRIFGIAILIAAFQAFVFYILYPNIFLISVGILSLYLVGIGWQFSFIRDYKNSIEALLTNWLFFVFMIVFAFFFKIGIQTIHNNTYFEIVDMQIKISY